MCAKHWRMVPRAVQVLVYKHYQPGQCELSPAPSTKWHAAADWAIACVAQKEGFITRETLERIAKKVRPVLNERNN